MFSQFFDKDSMEHFLSLQLWHLFKYTELAEVVRQNEKPFIDLLNKVRVGNIDDDVENLLKARLVHESDENYSKDALQMSAENEPAMKRNEAVLNELPGKLYTVDANAKIPDNRKYPLAIIKSAHNQKQAYTGDLGKLLKLKINAKIILTVNIDIQGRLIKCQTGIIRHIEFDRSSARKVYVKFSDEKAGSKAMRSSYLGRQNSWVPIEKCETETSIKKESASPSLKRTQFPLTLAWKSTVQKVQNLSLEQGVIGFDLKKTQNHLDQDNCIVRSVG